MKIDETMTEKGGGVSSHGSASPNLANPLDTQLSQGTGWRGFLRRRGSDVEALPKIDSSGVHPAAISRKTSLTPEMDQIPTRLLEKKLSEDIPSPGTSPQRSSLLQGFMGYGGGIRRGSIMEAMESEEEFRPPEPESLGRRSSMTDAFQWLFKPMNVPAKHESRDINVFSPTST